MYCLAPSPATIQGTPRQSPGIGVLVEKGAVYLQAEEVSAVEWADGAHLRGERRHPGRGRASFTKEVELR